MNIIMKDIETKILERMRKREKCIHDRRSLCTGSPFQTCCPCIREMIEEERKANA